VEAATAFLKNDQKRPSTEDGTHRTLTLNRYNLDLASTTLRMNPPFEEDYRNALGMIVMCMYCRKTQCNSPGGQQWVLVKEFLGKPPDGVSHGLCPECLDKQYPQPE
jgi:hypothetical protein